ncbi:unnamed protein product [Musa banksii]
MAKACCRSTKHLHRQYKRLLLLQLIANERVKKANGSRAIGEIDGEDLDEGVKANPIAAAHPYHRPDIIVAGRQPSHLQVRLQVPEPHLPVPITIHHAERLRHDAVPAAGAAKDALELLELHEPVAVGVGGGDHGTDVLVREGRGDAGREEGLEVVLAYLAVAVGVEDVERRPEGGRG